MENSKPTDHPRSRRKPGDKKQTEPAAPRKPDVANDPILSQVSRKLLWQECVLVSDETPETKLFLLVIGRFFDSEGQSSDMNYAQVARECSLSVRFCKYAAKRARDRWLRVEKNQGFKHAKGYSNKYHAMVPPSLVDTAREAIRVRLSSGASRAPLGSEVSSGAPVLDSVNQEENLSRGGEGTCGNDDGSDADATNVVPLHRPSWGRDLLKGGHAVSTHTARSLYHHQIRGMSMVAASYKAGHRRIGFNAPTGSGKGEVMSVMTRGSVLKGNGVLITVPFKTLVDQQIDRLWQHGVREVGAMQADHPLTNMTMPVQVATLQTAARRSMPAPGLVLVDEFHINFKFIADMMQRWPTTLFTGFSASPGTKGLGRIWQDLVTPTTTRELIETINPATGRAFLSPFRPFAADHPDLSGVKLVAGDFHEGQLSERMRGTKLTANAAETYLTKAKGRRCLVFCVDKAHADAVLEMYCSMGIFAELILAETPQPERRDIFRRFEAKEVEALISVGCLTTGVDLPFADCMQLCRPTRSAMLFKQMAGRVLRDYAGKTDALIFDHSTNLQRLGFPDEIEWTTLDDGKPNEASKTEKKPTEPIECGNCHAIVRPVLRACPECGHTFKRQSQVSFASGQLSEVKRGAKKPKATMAEKQLWWSGFLHYAQQRAKNRKWCLAQYKQKCGVWPNLIQDIATEPSAQILGWIKSKQIAWAKSQHNSASVGVAP